MDYLEERKLNLRDMNLKHVRDEIYLFEGIEIDMSGCGRTHMQMYRHIAQKLVFMVFENSMMAMQLKDVLAFLEEKDLGDEFSLWLHENDAEKAL